MSARRIRLTILLLLAIVCSASAGLPLLDSDPSIVGQWSDPVAWPHAAVHSVLLPTGKVLFWGYESREATLWDTVTDELTPVPLGGDVNIFCAGHTLLADGRLLIAGGNLGFFKGPRATHFFDAFTETWSRGPDMNIGRYYPNLLTLADGRVVALGGNDEAGARVHLAEVLTPGADESWQLWDSATAPQDEYPKTHLLTDGRVVRVSPEQQTRFLDPATQAWTDGPMATYGYRQDASSVVLPGLDRILLVAGGGFPTATNQAEILDLDGTPEWRPIGDTLFDRRNQNLVTLPTGDVLLVGGANNARLPVLHPELFDSETETWSVMAPHDGFRTYHSTTVLLPDGRVMAAGGDTELGFVALGPLRTMEVFSPPYLFAGPRPTITSAPSEWTYGGVVTLETPEAPAIERVVLSRLSSVTHSFDFDGRHVELPFTAAVDSLTVSQPADGSQAPPGWYLLFLVDADGVPSMAKAVRLS